MTIAEAKRQAGWLKSMLAEQQRIKQAANQMAASAQAEAQRIKAKLPLPPAASEGMFEVRFVQALVEIMTGRATVAKPDMVKMPETPYEQIALVLSLYRPVLLSCHAAGLHLQGLCLPRKVQALQGRFPGTRRPARKRERLRKPPGGSPSEGPFPKVQKPAGKSLNFSRPWPTPRGSKITKNTCRTITPPTGCMNSTPWTTKHFCKSARRLEKIQARLKALGDAGQWECKEYKDLEREEHRYCVSLGY